MIKRTLAYFLLALLCVYVQSTWLHAVEILSVIPDLALVVLIFASYRSAGAEGQAAGFAVGIVQDFLSSVPTGLNAFVKTAVSWSFNLLSGKFYIDRILMPLAFGFVGVLLKALYIFALSLLFAKKFAAYSPFEAKLWVEAAYTAVVTPFLFLFLEGFEYVFFRDRKDG